MIVVKSLMDAIELAKQRSDGKLFLLLNPKHLLIIRTILTNEQENKI